MREAEGQKGSVEEMGLGWVGRGTGPWQRRITTIYDGMVDDGMMG